MERNIVLTGFMGTGKTTVGKLLAEKLNYQFLDTDEIIMKRCGSTVAEIFSTQGEDTFRKMEHDLAVELSNSRGKIISTGGKMMLDRENAAALQKSGDVFCLVASADSIISRISVDEGVERPLLKVSDPVARVRELLFERREGYAAFTQVETTGRSPEDVCSFILSLFKADF